MQKAISILLLFCTVLFLSSCQKNIIVPESGHIATGKSEDIMRTYLFDFTVLSVQEATDFKQVIIRDKAAKFVIVEISVKNTSDEDLIMYDNDFQLQWGLEGFSETIGYAHNSMAPFEKTLAAGETMQCYYVFTAPKIINAFSICYVDDKHLLDDSPLTAPSFYVEFIT